MVHKTIKGIILPKVSWEYTHERYNNGFRIVYSPIYKPEEATIFLVQAQKLSIILLVTYYSQSYASIICKGLAMNGFEVMMMTQRIISFKNQLSVWIAASQNKCLMIYQIC